MASETLPAPAAAGALAAPGLSPFVHRFPMARRAELLLANPLVRKSLPAIVLGGGVGMAALAWLLLATPDQRALYPQASEADRAAMADALSAANVAYSIDDQTGTISVGADSYYRARMLLAEQGLPQSGAGAGEDLAAIPMGASRAVEGEHVRASREADLARTIEQIDVVETARVHIAEPPSSVFLRDNDQPTASVMLTLRPGRTMSDAQVQAVMGLVSTSLPGLDASRVSVVDQRGQLLSQQAMLSGSDAERQFALQQRVENAYQRSITALLTPIVGADNFTTEVHVDLDFSETRSTRETVPTGPPVIEAEIGQISSDASAAPAVGIPGTLSNVPPPAATPTDTPPAAASPVGTPAANRNENYNRRFALGREVSVTNAQAPNLRRLTVAVALRNAPGARARSAAEIQALDALVKGAIGFDAARGDIVAINARPFSSVEAMSAPWWQAPWVELLARNVTALALAALFLFGLFWPMFRRWTKARAQRASALAAQHMEAQMAAASHIGSEAAARQADGNITLDMIDHVQSYEGRAEMVRAFVRQDPDRATLVVRDLIKQDVEADGVGND